jgi:hypothetical protein
MQGAQKLRSEAHLQLRRNDEVEAQRRRWTFYKTIKNWGQMNPFAPDSGYFTPEPPQIPL